MLPVLPKFSALLLGFHLLLLAASSQHRRTSSTNWHVQVSAGDSSAAGFVEALARKPACTEARNQEMDACASKMGFLGDHQFQVPTNASAMGAFCEQLKESIGCIQSYSRDCLQGFTKLILSRLLRRGKQQYSSICQHDSARSEFINKLACLNEPDKMTQFNACMDASIARFEFIRDQVQTDNRLPALCCSYQIFQVDTGATLGRLCGPTNPAAKFVQRLVTGTTGDFFQLICENHRTMDECKLSDKTRQYVAKLEETTKAAKSGQLRAKSKSLIPPLLDILDNSKPV